MKTHRGHLPLHGGGFGGKGVGVGGGGGGGGETGGDGPVNPNHL